MTEPRHRCGICEQSRPWDLTEMVRGPRSGNYRRAGALVDRRVCRDCLVRHVEWARARAVSVPPVTVYLDQLFGRGPCDGQSVARACDELGVDYSGVHPSRYTRKAIEGNRP